MSEISERFYSHNSDYAEIILPGEEAILVPVEDKARDLTEEWMEWIAHFNDTRSAEDFSRRTSATTDTIYFATGQGVDTHFGIVAGQLNQQFRVEGRVHSAGTLPGALNRNNWVPCLYLDDATIEMVDESLGELTSVAVPPDTLMALKISAFGPAIKLHRDPDER